MNDKNKIDTNNEIDPQNKKADHDFEDISFEDLAHLAWGGSRTSRDSPKKA
jgi:hypothetical protein